MKRADLAEKTSNYSKNLCFPNSWSCASELLFGCFLIVNRSFREKMLYCFSCVFLISDAALLFCFELIIKRMDQMICNIFPNHNKEPLWQKIRKLLIMNRQIWKIR